MQVFIDLDLRQIVASSGSKSPLASVWVKAQDTVSLSVYFVQNNAIVNPGSGVAASMMFGMVSQGTPSTILSLTTSFTLQTDGSSNPYYLGLLNLNTVPMAAAISACKTTALACSAEFRYQLPDGEIFHSFNTTFQVYPSLLAESGVTQPANVATYPASSALELLAHKNVSSGYAGLNSSSKITGSQIPIDGTTITLVGGALVSSPYTDPQTAINTSDITSLQASRTADESDITSLKASRTTDEAAILSNTGRLTSLETSRTSDEATIAAQTTSINSLSSSRTTDETNISANSSAITALQARRLDQFAAPNVDLSIGSHKLTNVATPSTGTDAANKAYVDAYSPTIPESQVTGLVSDLAGKLSTSGTISESQVTNLVSDLAGKLSTSGTIAESQVTNLVTDLGTLTTNVSTNGTAITALEARRLDQFSAPNVDLSIGSHKLTNVSTPTTGTDAANKTYVDGIVIPESQVTNLVSDLATHTTNIASGVTATTAVATRATSLETSRTADEATIASHTTSIASLNAGSATRGAWSTQAIDGGATIRLEDEFCINDPSGTAFSGNLQWVKVVATSGAIGQSASIPNASTYAYVGANFFSPTATILSAGALTLKGTGIFQSKSYIDHAFRTFMTPLPTSAQNVTILIGLTTSTNADLTGTFFGFEFNPVVSNNWQFTTGTANSSPTRVDLGSNYVATTNATWLRLQQTEVTWQTINVSINGAFSTPLTSGIASDTSNLYYPCMKVVRTVAGATTINAYIDTWRALITTSR